MSSVRIYVATSADGYIADRDGSVDWLGAFDARAYGYDRFWSEIGCVVMGRRTYDRVRTFADDWPYAGRKGFVLASQAVAKPPPKEVAVAKASVGEVVGMAKSASAGDVWIVGGAVTMRSALEQGLVDLVEVFLVPVFLGQGIPLLGALKAPVQLSIRSMETYADGVVKLAYQPSRRR